MEEKKKKTTKPNVSAPAEAKKTNKKKTEKVLKPVTFVSVDNRPLEVNINSDKYLGKKITVPGKLEGEVSRILKEGGLYFKKIKTIEKGSK